MNSKRGKKRNNKALVATESFSKINCNTQNKYKTREKRYGSLDGFIFKKPKIEIENTIAVNGHQLEDKDDLEVSNSLAIKKPRIDDDTEETIAANGHQSEGDDDIEVRNSLEIKKPRIDTENIEDPDVSKEILCRKKCPNPFDSSDSESDASYENETDDLAGDNMAILDFFNTATFDDLSQITGCSELKSKKIIESRPFRTIDHLKSNKFVNASILEDYQEVIIIKRNLTELLLKCERISANLMKRIKSFFKDTEMSSTIPDDGIIEQPKILTSGMQLKKYQLVGINWLRIVHEENVNGILADEMGLGKTIQTIAFLAYLYDVGQKGPHLVIVPTSTLNNWHREFQLWCPQLKVILYHGSQEERRRLRSKIITKDKYNVILTTYNTSISNKDDRIFIKKMNFHYGIFDEAHMLKNMHSIRYQYLSNFKITRKLLLTGTPLQNNLVELISLLSFVMPTMFLHSNDGLKRIFQMSQKKSQTPSPFDDERIRQLKEMLDPFCLRRLKSQVLSQMPAKTVEVVRLPLSDEQSRMYTGYIKEIHQRRFEEKNPIPAMGAVMELRKISSHSLLVKNRYTDEILRKMSRDMLLDEDHITSSQELIFEDFSVMHDFEIHKHCLLYPHAIGKYQLDQELLLSSNKIQYLDENLPKLIAGGDRVLIFSQFVMVLDIIGDFLTYRNLPFLRLDGSTPLDDRQDYIDDFNDNGDIHLFLLSTRAGGLGINLASANTVILHDIDYNPYTDRQAEDRCHRIGQLRDVRVIKLISKDTIEECMLGIATKKLKLEEITTDGDGVEEEVDFKAMLREAISLMK